MIIKVSRRVFHALMLTILYSTILALFGLLCAKHAMGQTFDPNPVDPYAQQIAEDRAVGALLGITPPPIGWECSLNWDTFQFTGPVSMHCEPIPALIEQQQQEYQQWLERLRDRSPRRRTR